MKSESKMADTCCTIIVACWENNFFPLAWPTSTRTMSATLKPYTSDEDFRILKGEQGKINWKEPRITSSRFYSVVVSILGFLQWFLGILFFGPVQRLWSPSQIILPSASVKDNIPRMSRIFVLDSVSSCDNFLQSYRAQYPFKMNFLGLDCEWVNKKGQTSAPVALLQIATPLCDCFLIRLCKMGNHLPQTVRDILEDKSVLKFGVGIQDDAKKLSGMFGVAVLGCVDLRHVVQRCRLYHSGEQRYLICSHTCLCCHGSWSVYHDKHPPPPRERGWCSDERTHLLSMWPSSNPGIDTICVLSMLLVLPLIWEVFSLDPPVLSSPWKPTLPNSNSI